MSGSMRDSPSYKT